MNDIQEKINSESFLGVKIDANKISDILTFLNDHQKDHEIRISQIEAMLQGFVQKGDFQQFQNKMMTKFEELEKLQNEQKEEMNNAIKAALEKVDNSIHEMLVTQSVKTKSMLDEFNSKLQDAIKDVEKLDDEVHNHHENLLNVHKKTDELIPKDIDELNARLKFVYSELNKLKNLLNHKNNNGENAQGEPNANDPFLKEHTFSHEQPDNENVTERKIGSRGNQGSLDAQSLAKLKEEIVNELQARLGDSKNTLVLNHDLQANLDEQNEKQSSQKSPHREGSHKDNGDLINKVIDLTAKTNILGSSLKQVSSQITDLDDKYTKLSKKLDIYTESPPIDHFDQARTSEAPLPPDTVFDAQSAFKNVNLIVQQNSRQILQQEEELLKLSDQIIDLKDQVKEALYLMVDDFRLLHCQADGLERIPIPDYENKCQIFKDDEEDFEDQTSKYTRTFPPKVQREHNDDDYDYSLDDTNDNNGTRKKSSRSARRGTNANLNDILVEQPDKDIKKISGLLHLVTNYQKRPEIIHQTPVQTHQHHQRPASISAKKSRSNLPEIEEITGPSTAKKPVKLEGTEKFVLFDVHNVAEPIFAMKHRQDSRFKELQDQIDNQSDKQSKLEQQMAEVLDLSKKFGSLYDDISRKKDELMVAVDRKVDRDLVERLFDKFRVLINELNDRISKIQSGYDGYATVKQVEGLLKMITEVKETLNIQDATAAGKAPFQECLVCGRNVSRVTGGITSRSLGDSLESTQFVYGEGGVFLKTKLPPLKDLSA